MTTPFSLDKSAPLIIAAMKTEIVTVTYAPKMAVTSMAQLEIDSPDPGIAMQVTTINLMGVGISPMINASPVSLDFGEVEVGKTSDAKTVTIRNGSTKPQKLDKVTSDDPHFVVDVSTFNPDVGGGGNTAVNVTFTPDAEGVAAGRIQVYLPGQTMAVATVLVSGTGLAVVMAPPARTGCGVGGHHGGTTGAGALLVLVSGLALVVRRRRTL
jgi:hypothetical protein